MDNEIVYSSKATDQKAQYDASAKRLLGQKIILAHILIRVVEEFKGMDADTVASLIEGEPYISQIPVEPGLTNKETVDARTGERIVGLNTESSEIDEGKVCFDIIFYVRMRDGLAKMIINLEAQKNEPTKYHILNRAIFYTARLVSSQKEREFTGSDYNEIKQVYSIWICMNMKENSLSHIHMVKDDLLGDQDWKGNLDISNIVMIGLAKEIPPKEERYELHRLLGALLSQTMTAEQKLKLMKQEYDIPVDRRGIRDEVKIMCNLSEGVEDLIKELKGSGAVYAKKTINGITYHTFTASAKNAKMTDIEKLLEEAGYTNVCLTKDFFYATFDPDNAAKNMSCIAGLTSKAAELQANDNYDLSNIQFFMKTNVTMKSKIKTTNGKLSNKSKTVKWTIKDASKKKNLYASTAKTTKTAKTTAVKNNKSYKAGKKITVSNSKSLVKMKLDGKAVKKNTVVKKKGTHTLTIWSKNGKVQNVIFTIK